MTAYWNVPFLPEKCRSSALDDTSYYSTLLRIAGTFTTFAQSFELLMEFYDWRHVVLVSDQTESYCHEAVSATSSILSASNYSVIWIQLSKTPSDTELKAALLQIRQNARGSSVN
jgi:Receptor family ligand binding region